MKKTKILFLVLVLIAGITLVLWEPWQMSRGPVEKENPAEVMAEARDRAEDINNYRYETEITVSNVVSVSLQNLVDREQEHQMVDFTWKIPKMSGTTKMFIKDKQVYILSPVKKQWVKPEQDPTVGPFVDFFYRQLDLVDPVENLMKAGTNNNNMSLVRPEEQDTGSENKAAGKGNLIGIEVIPEAGSLTEITDAMPPQLKGAELENVRQIFWISPESFLPARYEVHARVSFFGLTSMEFKAVTVTSNYNKTEVTAPQTAQKK